MFNLNTYGRLLDTQRLGAELSLLDETESTNTYIASRLDWAGVEKMVVLAERQTAGRGRFGRVWSSFPGVNLAFSLAWPVPSGFDSPNVVTLAAGVALSEAVGELVEVSSELKYPNDLMLEGKKAAGVLTELKKSNGGSFAVIGVGVNVNTDAAQFPDEIKGHATSLKLAAGENVPREAVLALFLNNLERSLDLLEKGDTASVLNRYKSVSNALGKEIIVTVNGNEEAKGVAVDIDAEGGLVLEVAPGEHHTVKTGETRFVY